MLHTLKPSVIKAITKQNLLASMSKLPADVPNILMFMENSKRNEIQDRLLRNKMLDSIESLSSNSKLAKLLKELNEYHFKRSK